MKDDILESNKEFLKKSFLFVPSFIWNKSLEHDNLVWISN